MEFSPEQIVPWELIGAALQGNITADEEAQLQQWIASSAENQDLFNRLQQLWAEEVTDYPAYQDANETMAWNELRARIEQQPNKIVKGKRVPFMRWVAVAALVVIMAGAFTWYAVTRNHIYETGNAEQRMVALQDGSSIKLYPGTSVEVPRNYNQSTRRVTLKSGEAFFEVKHNEQVPFIVNMGATQVRDLGTRFLVVKGDDSVKVSVINGKVAFTYNATSETRELSAGMNLTFQLAERNAAPVISVDSTNADKQNLLRFTNTYLSEVVLKLQEVYRKKIVLTDSTLAQKRFTGHLDGLSFDEAMNILCKSLNIKYISENGVYYMK